MPLNHSHRTIGRFDTSLSFELLGTWIVAILLPGLGWQIANLTVDIPATNRVSLLSASAAVVLAVWFSRNFARYPGIKGGSHVIGASFSGYSVLAVIMLLTRASYSIAIFASSFLLATAWLVAWNIYSERRRTIRIGLVPTGAAQRLNAIPGVEWQMLATDEPVCNLTAVAADFHSDMSPQWERCLSDYALAGVPVYHFKQLIESLTGRVELDHLSENSFGSLVPSIGYLKLKMLLDRALALVALVLLLPALGIVALLVRAESPGPAIFRQQRMGFGGHRFVIFKFRTMRIAEDEGDALASSMTKVADARITRLGAFLRRTRIDELPQIVNILRGEMSWIGPRPEAAVLSDWYEKSLPFYRYRHIVPPGITGWAQINQGHVTSVEDVRLKLDYDFYYVKNVSFWLDTVIVVRTIITVLTGHGAI